MLLESLLPPSTAVLLLIRNRPSPMSTLVPACRRCRCCSYAGSLRETCSTSLYQQLAQWNSNILLRNKSELPPCHAIKYKAWCIFDTWIFIPKTIQWHIHTGSWSIVNCWQEGPYEALYKRLMNINEMAIGLMQWLGLDGNRCMHDTPTVSNRACMARGFWHPILSYIVSLHYRPNACNQS